MGRGNGATPGVSGRRPPVCRSRYPGPAHGWARYQPGVGDKAGAGEHLLGEQFVPPIAFVPESRPPFLRSQLLGGLGGAGAASELDCSSGLSVRLGWEFQVRTGAFPPYALGCQDEMVALC